MKNEFSIALNEYKKAKNELETAKKKCRDLHYKKIGELCNEYLDTKRSWKRKKIEKEINDIQKQMHLFY